MKKYFLAAATAAGVLSGSAALAEPVKIGMLITLSGPPAVLGKQLRDGFQLAMEKLDGKLGGKTTELIIEDDELKPDVAISKAKSLVGRDKVDFVVGTIFSNMLAAVFKPIIKSNTFLISPNAGPSTFAGKNCNPLFFVTSFQNDQNFEILGKHAEQQGFKSVFLLAPNYQAGKDAVNGFKRQFTGKIVDTVFTQLGQKDYSAEIAKLAAAKPDALFTFMPGGMGVRFVKQFRAAGLADKMTFLSAFTVDEATLPAQKDAALGFFGGASWAPNMKTPGNAEFVAAFEGKYGYVPSVYAMQGFDTAMLLDSVIRKVGENLSDKKAVRNAIRAADFQSLRGSFKFNTNQYPVQDYYLMKVAKRADGKFQTEIDKKIFSAAGDFYAKDCKMSW